jgi:hypothetical protein
MVGVPFDAAITDAAALRARYREPNTVAVEKEVGHLDRGARDFLAHTTFLVLATSGPHGTDASPRGGPAGFVAVLDDHRLAFGDLAGNNRVDSHANLVAQPEVGVLFVVPGLEETLRLNGRATLTADPGVLDATTVGGRRPRLAVGIDVERCYIHCGKALRRGGLWQPESWPPPEARPDAACILHDHLGLDVEPATIAANLEASYRRTIWEPGGEADPPARPPAEPARP